MNSSTIHKACGLVPANNPSGFTAQGDCTICGFIGIDEMSMVGEHLFAYAIDAVLSSPSTRIVLLGDTDQLAPVARGDVLRDLIKCGVIKTVRLDVNYRQGSTSTITDKRMYDCCTPLRGADNRYCRVKGLNNQFTKALLR